jgi:hypothetical protein
VVEDDGGGGELVAVKRLAGQRCGVWRLVTSPSMMIVSARCQSSGEISRAPGLIIPRLHSSNSEIARI